MIVWLALNARKACSEETGAYCDARRRLPLEVIVRLVHQTAREIDDGCPDRWLWKKRRVLLGDGSTVSMPDTPRNQCVFPQSRSQGIGPGFPLARLVVLISLASGVVHDLALGPYRGKETGETALFRKLLKQIKAIAGHRVGDRPGRVEPCANKRRPKKQRYLNEPRKQARDA